LDDDCYLPGRTRPVSELSHQASLKSNTGACQGLRSGLDRVLAGLDPGWWAEPGDWVEYRFEQPVHLSRARLTLDSDLSQTKRMPCWIPIQGNQTALPPMLLSDFDLAALDSGGSWQTLRRIENNSNRLLKIPLDVETSAVRLIPQKTWGGERAHVMAFELG
jgi:hypothetical protein